MATIVNIHEAKTHLSRLIERARNGEEILIAKAGNPQVRLVAVPSTSQRTPGRFAGQITIKEGFFDPLPEEELTAWEGERDSGSGG